MKQNSFKGLLGYLYLHPRVNRMIFGVCSKVWVLSVFPINMYLRVSDQCFFFMHLTQPETFKNIPHEVRTTAATMLNECSSRWGWGVVAEPGG